MVEVKPKTEVKLRAVGECASHSLAEIRVRDQHMTIDEPIERGGTNKGPTPTDTALSALVGCTNVIGHKVAHKMGLDIRITKVSVIADFDRRGVLLSEEVDVPFPAIKLDVSVEGDVSEDDLRRLQDDVAMFCPIAKLFRMAGTEITENWTKAG